MQTAPPKNEDFEIDDEKLEQQLKESLVHTFFKPKQVFYVTYEKVLLVLTVTKSEIMQIGAKLPQNELDGRLIK